MRRLLLLRHAAAERAGPGESDQARPLSAEGQADAAAVGAYLGSHSFRPDRVLVSMAARAQETWRQVAAALRAPPEAVSDRRIYNAAPQALLTVASETPDDARAVMLVGHNPGLHEMAMLLTATGDIETRERLCENLPTSGLVILDFALDRWSKLHPRSGRLERFISPKAIAGATN
jgi:phosphohistidine phosphatase